MLELNVEVEEVETPNVIEATVAPASKPDYEAMLRNEIIVGDERMEIRQVLAYIAQSYSRAEFIGLAKAAYDVTERLAAQFERDNLIAAAQIALDKVNAKLAQYEDPSRNDYINPLSDIKVFQTVQPLMKERATAKAALEAAQNGKAPRKAGTPGSSNWTPSDLPEPEDWDPASVWMFNKSVACTWLKDGKFVSAYQKQDDGNFKLLGSINFGSWTAMGTAIKALQGKTGKVGKQGEMVEGFDRDLLID